MICQPNAVGRCALLASWSAHPWPGPRQRPPRDGRAMPDLVLRTYRGEHIPRGLLAVVRGVVLDEALDELVDGAGLGQAALAGLVGQLLLGQALVALTGLGVGLLALLPLDLRGLLGLLPLGLLGRRPCLGLGPLGLLSLVAGCPLEGVDAAAGAVGDALHLLAHGAADRIDLLAGDAGQRVGNLGQGAGVLVVEVHDPLEDGELLLDGLGGVQLRNGGEGREGPELVGDGAHAALPALQRAGELVLGPAGNVGEGDRESHVVLKTSSLADTSLTIPRKLLSIVSTGG